MKTWQWAALAGTGLVGAYLIQSLRPTGGSNQPPKQPHPDDDIARLTDSGEPHCQCTVCAGYYDTPGDPE